MRIYSFMLMHVAVMILSNTAYMILLAATGLGRDKALIYSLIFSVLTELLSRFNLRLTSITLSSKLDRVSVIKTEGMYLIQPVAFRVSQRVSLEVNLGGTLVPLIISFIAVAYITLNYSPNGLYTYLALLATLTLVISRLSVVIKGLGLAVPIFIASVTISVFSAIAVLITGLPTTASALYAYAISCVSVLVGVDMMNLRRIPFYDVRRLIIGGLGRYDALIIIPATSSTLAYVIVTFTGL